jgi:hypothetical protein
MPEGPLSVSGAPNLPAGFAEQSPEELLAALTPFLAPYIAAYTTVAV